MWKKQYWLRVRKEVYLVHSAVTTAFCSIWHFINMLCEQVLAAEGLKCQFLGNCRALGSIQTNSGLESKPVGKMQQANVSVE